MLKIDGISSGYGGVPVLHDVSLDVPDGEIVCVLGRNGAGKTTLMKTVMGLLPATSGRVVHGDVVISDLPAHEIAGHGIGYIPQGRRLFGELTVAANLKIGLMAGGGSDDNATLDQVLSMFPRLAERMEQRADTLSGGEQQMLATARALCLKPKLLLLDEPTEGLQPSMISLIRNTIIAMKKQGVGVLLVEQRVDAVLTIADSVVFLENGRAHAAVPASELRDNPELLRRYVGV